MKRFQRVNAFILAVALFMSMVPAGALPVIALDAENTQMVEGSNYLHASYSEETITVDGTMNLTDEPAYRRTISLSGGKLSVAWGAGNLYVASEATITSLEIKGKTVTLAANAKEVKIPLSELEITDLTKTYDFSIKVGTMTEAWTAKLIFDANVYAKSPTHKNVAYGAAALDTAGWQYELDSLRTNGVNETTSGQLKYDMYYPKLLSDRTTPVDFAVSYDAPTVVEMDVEVKYLPNLTAAPRTYANWTSRNIVNALAITIRDNSGTANAGDALVTCIYRIGTDIYLMYPDNANATVHSVKIGTYSEDYAATESYHLRMEYSYRLVSGKTVADVAYYVNGKLVAKQTDVYKNGSWAAAGPIIQMVAYGDESTDETKRVEAVVANLSVTHADADVEILKANYTQAAAAAKPVIELIEKIDDVVKLSSKGAVDTAYEEYEKLSDAARAMVSNADKLLKAKAHVEKLEKSYPYALFATAPMSWDGKADEAIYTRAVWLSDTLKMSLAWDADYLYLAFTDTNTDTLNVSNLMFDGQPVTVNGENSKTTKGVQEIRIPLDQDTLNLARSYAISFQVGNFGWGGEMAFDTSAFAPLTLTTPTQGGSRTEDKTSVSIKDPTKRSTTYATINADLLASTTAATVVEFDLEINKLYADTTAYDYEYQYMGKGLNFQIADNLVATDTATGNVIQAFKFGFFLRDGVIKLGHAANGAHKFVAIDDDGTGKFHVRVEYTYNDDADKTVSAKYYINDMLVASGENVRVNTGSIGTTANQRVFLKADAGESDIAWSNLSVSQTNSELYTKYTDYKDVIDAIKNIGTVTLDKKQQILDAWGAYDLLDPQVQKLVYNLDVLETAESRLNVLENSYLHAMFSPAPMIWDGKADESIYTRALWLSDTLKVRLAWDAEYLYLAFTDANTPDISNLVINSKTVTLGDYSKTSTGVREIRIPLDKLGIEDVTKSYTLSFQVGSLVWSGKIVFDTSAFETVNFSKPTYGAVSEDKKEITLVKPEQEKFVNSKGEPVDTLKGTDYVSFDKNDNLKASTAGATVVELDLQINNLPNDTTVSKPNKYDSQYIGIGLNFWIVDDLAKQDANNKDYVIQAFKFGFFNRDGKLYFGHASNGENKFVVVSDGSSGKFHVRVEYTYNQDNTVSAVYFVNDVQVATGTNVRVDTGSLGTTGNQRVFLKTDYVKDEAEKTDVVWSNLSVSKTDPKFQDSLDNVDKVIEKINKIGTVTLDSRTDIDNAQIAFDALNPMVQYLVTNLDVLEKAERTWFILNNSYLHGVFATSVVVDGNLNEAAYRRILPLSGSLYTSMAWDKDNLYLAFAGEKTPNVTQLKINGIDATLSANKTGNGTREIAIKLKDVGMDGYTGSYTFTVQVDGVIWSGKLVLDTVDHEVLKHGTLTYGADSLDNKEGFKLDSWATIKETDANNMSTATVNTDKLTSVAGAATVVEFDMTPDYLPDGYKVYPKPARTFLENGLTVTVRDEKDAREETTDKGTEAFVFGLGKKDGELYLVYWYNDVETQKHKYAEVPLGISDSYHVRVEYAYGEGTAVTAKYYVNGVLVVTQEESRIVKTDGGNFAINAGNCIQFVAYVDKSVATETFKVVTTVKNVSVGHEQPSLMVELTATIKELEDEIASIGAVTMEKADQIKATLAKFNNLSATAQKLVKNASVLWKALVELNRLENSSLHAVFTPVDMVLDGKADESIFRRALTLGTTKFGAAWDLNNLYLFFADTKTPDITELKINGKTVKATGTTGDGVREFQIALKDLGITKLTENYKISFKIGNQVWLGELVLDTVDYNVLQYNDLYYGVDSDNDKMSVVLNSSAQSKEDDPTNITFTTYKAENLEAVIGGTTVLEFAFDSRYMPNDCTVGGANRNFMYGGLGVLVRDQLDETNKEGFIFGLGKKNGQMTLFYYSVNAEGKAEVKEVAVYEATQNYVRVEYTYVTAEVVSAKYYVNGVLVAESENVRVMNGSFGTTTPNFVQFFASVEKGTESETNRVDVTLHNVSVGHTSPNLVEELTVTVAEVEKLIANIGPVTQDRADYIKSVQERFNQLSAVAQKLVKNANALQKALNELNALENTYLHAVFTPTSVVVDGALNEPVFRRNLTLGTVKFGAAWDAKNLYLFFADTKTPNITELKINGKKVNATGATGNGVREIQVAMKDLGITNLADTYPITVKIGNQVWSGKLILDNVDFGVVPHGNLYNGATSLNNKESFKLDTWVVNKEGESNYMSFAQVVTEKFNAVTGAATVVEFDMAVENMPDGYKAGTAPGRAFMNNGITVSIRDNTDDTGKNGFVFGLGKKDGQMYLVCWYQDAAKNKKAEILVGEADNCHVRVEYAYGEGTAVTAKYYINGVLIHEQESSYLTGVGFGTSTANIMQIFAIVPNDDATQTHKVVATFDNISVGHSQPTLVNDLNVEIPKVEALIDAIGLPVTMDSKDKIDAALDAYNKLSDLAKTQVSNLDVLETAQARLKMLEMSYVHATFSSEDLVLDGKLFEPAYHMNIKMTDTMKFGAAWSKNYLYLAFEDETAPEVSDLVINGKKVNVTFLNSKTGAIGREIRVSLASVGIVGYDKTHTISFRAGDVFWSGTLVQDSGEYMTMPHGNLYYGATGSSDKSILVLNTLTPDADGGNKNRSLGMFLNEKLGAVSGKMTILDMDIAINNMPNNSTAGTAPGRNFMKDGVTFTYLDDQSPAAEGGSVMEGMVFGLGKQNGKLMLFYWYNDAEGNAQLGSVDVPVANSYHLRVEYGNGNGKVTSAKYYINGLLLAETASSRVTAGSSYGTASQKIIQIFAQASMETEAGRVDLSISNVSASHPQILIIDDESAAAYMDQVIAALGDVTRDSTEKVVAARELYNSLTSAQKKLVTKYAALQAAEAKLRALMDQINEKFTQYAFAEYTTEAMTIDGKLQEKIWRVKQTIFGAGKLGMAWDFNYLYLTVTGSKINTFKDLKINGKAVTDLGVVNGDIREMKILLSSVGIKAIDFTRGYDLSFSLNGKTWEGQLIFDTGKYAIIKPTSTYWGGSKDQNDGILNSLDSTSRNRVGLYYNSTKLESTNGKTTIVEFDLKINSMPNNGYDSGINRNFLVGGVSIAIHDDDVTLGENGLITEGFLLGLVRQKGNMYLVYWEDSTDEFIYAPVDDWGTNNYHLRIEYEYHTNDDVSAKYYVNGLLVAESHDAKELAEDGVFGTSGSCRIQVTGYGTAEEPLDAIISDLSISQNRYMENPDPRDEITKDAIFGVLDLNHVQKDLNLPKEFITINGERFELTWRTSNSAVVTKEGKVTRPLEETASASLTLVVDGEELWAVNVKVDPMSLEEYESPENVDAAFSKAPIVIDGILDDEGWRMSGRVLDRNKQIYAEYGFQWTQSFLYVAVEYLNGISTLSLKLNGRYFTLQDGKLYRGGEDVGGSGALAVTNGDVVELRIPLSVLGLPSKISSYGYSIPMSLKAGPYVGNGKALGLSNTDWVVTVNRNQETLGENIKTNDAYHGAQRLANGYRLFDLYGGTNKAGTRSYVYLYRTDEYYENFSDRTYANRVEFDFYADALPVLPTDGSAYRPTGGIYSVSGPTFTLSDVAGPDNYAYSCSFGIINTIHGLMFVLNVGGAVQTQLMHKQVGEKFSLAAEWASDDSLKVFIDGELLTTFYGASAWKSGSGDASLGINMYTFFEPQSVADNYDVQITNIGFGKVHYEENLLNQLTFEDICGKNRTESKITSDLVLPTSITNGQLDKEYKITWTSSNPALDAATGKVTRPELGAAVVTLTATLSNGESKSFDLIVYGSKAQNDGVLHVQDDLDPATGIGNPSKDIVFTFDATNNSIIKVLDGEATINYVVLNDGDDKARLVPENLTLWVSDDNQVYTRIKNFKLLQVGEKWYLYDFEAKCKYVKVHYTQPDNEESTFIGSYGEMINAGYQKVFGASDDTVFTKTEYVLTNNTGKTQQDYAWTISKKDLGITGNDAAIRIYAEGKLLYHYVSGSNVVVRINDLEKGASVTLTVLSSTGKDVMDISNKEGVHEVIYGVRDTTLSTSKYYYMTLPAGTTFPDGSKLEKETLFAINSSGCRTSTDGGITWDNTYQVIKNAPEGKEQVLRMSQGGWIFDSVTGRMMFECYRSVDKVTDENHMHTDIIASDDGGKTWYLQYTMPCRVCMDGHLGDNYVPGYALSYSDGIQLSTYDGKGSNVDFVFPLGYMWDNNGNFACYVCYTTDAGNTWHYSKTPVTYPSTYFGTEGGCSEGWIYERSDGVLVLQVRCQDKACLHFKVSYSFDKGLTWTNENVYTDFYAVNGQAVAKYMEVNGETTLISTWAGNSSMGGDTYHRNPFVFASSVNEGETFRNIQNITFRSFEERYEDIYTPNTTNIYQAKVGNNLIFNYTRNRMNDKVNTVIEDFDDWFTRTKGGYDNFEHGTVRYEGWQKVYGTVDLATDVVRGNYSMKLGYDAKAVRSVPYLQDGKISVDIYVPAGGSFTFELQSGHTRYYNSVSVPIAFRAEGGNIYFGDSTTSSAEGIKEGWNTLVFDLNMTKDKATMSVNGGAAINIPLKMDFDDYVNFITIGSGKDAPIYVDEVLIISDLEADVAVDAADKKAAAEVVELIKAIKNASNRAEAIKKARAAFDKLTQAQQDLVDMRVLADNGKTGLAGMINYYDELRMYEDGDLVVEKLIDEIGEVNHISGDKIKAAEDAYKKLTSAQKNKVSNYETLRVARLKYNRILAHKNISDQEAAETVQEMIDALILSNPLRYETKITAARKAYKALSADQLYKVDIRHLYQAELKLLEAKEVEMRRILASMQLLIDSLDNVTLEQIVLIEGLRANISKLTAEERAVLDDQKLVLAEKTLRSLKTGVDKKTLDEIRIAGIIAYIDSIGQVTIEKKALIDAIRASYDKLSEKQQERVENIDTLVIAEANVLAQLQLTDAVPNTGDTTPGVAENKTPVFAMFVMLFSVLAMAVLVILPKKRKNG